MLHPSRMQENIGQLSGVNSLPQISMSMLMDLFIAATSTSSLETPGKFTHYHVSRKPIKNY